MEVDLLLARLLAWLADDPHDARPTDTAPSAIIDTADRVPFEWTDIFFKTDDWVFTVPL